MPHVYRMIGLGQNFVLELADTACMHGTIRTPRTQALPHTHYHLPLPLHYFYLAFSTPFPSFPTHAHTIPSFLPAPTPHPYPFYPLSSATTCTLHLYIPTYATPSFSFFYFSAPLRKHACFPSRALPSPTCLRSPFLFSLPHPALPPSLTPTTHLPTPQPHHFPTRFTPPSSPHPLPAFSLLPIPYSSLDGQTTSWHLAFVLQCHCFT